MYEKPRVPRRPDYVNQDASTLTTFLITFSLIFVVAAVLYFGSAVTLPEIPDFRNVPLTSFTSPSSAAGPPARRSPTVAPSPTEGPAPTPTTVPRRTARVANTDGVGAYIWQEPGKTRITAWPDNTILELLSDERPSADAKTWRKVKDPRGREGWIPDIYIVVIEQ